jgi:hypothetical protein
MNTMSVASLLERVRVERDAITSNFVGMAIRVMDRSTADEIANEQHALADLFEELMPGEGSRWVHHVFSTAKAIRGQRS